LQAGGDAVSVLIKAPAKAELTFIIDGGGTPIDTGQKGHLRVPFACLVDRATMIADRTGSIQVDIWKSIYDDFPPIVDGSITGGNPPAINADNRYDDPDLTDWIKSLSEGDILAFNVDSVAGGEGGGTITRVTISLHVRKT
jgi:hypothetical protein